jgi:hypothetical protein
MQRFKGDINYSQVARNAIEKEIRKLELWADPVKNLGELIEKFRKQKEDLMDRWEKEGFEWGQDYIKSSSFVDAESYIEAMPELMQIHQPWPDDEALTEYTANYREDPDWTDTSAKAFWLGFAKGAKALWKEVQKQI